MEKERSSCKSFLHRVQDLLIRKPKFYDVVFLVGPSKIEVKGVRILLEAASPALEKNFELWENTVDGQKSGVGILLPEFDPEAFDIFVKLTMFDKWTVHDLKELKLQPGQILSLISICRVYEMDTSLELLHDLMNDFYRANHLDALQFPHVTNSKLSEGPAQPLVEKLRPELSTLDLTMDSLIIDNPSLACDGTENWNWIITKRKIMIHGLGFLGPINEDADYDVTIRIISNGHDKSFGSKRIEKRVSATKDNNFFIVFDQPIALKEGALNYWTNSYCIFFYLKGPNTKSLQREMWSDRITRFGSNEFRLGWGSCQLAEILYTNV